MPTWSSDGLLVALERDLALDGGVGQLAGVALAGARGAVLGLGDRLGVGGLPVLLAVAGEVVGGGVLATGGVQGERADASR